MRGQGVPFWNITSGRSGNFPRQTASAKAGGGVQAGSPAGHATGTSRTVAGATAASSAAAGTSTGAVGAGAGGTTTGAACAGVDGAGAAAPGPQAVVPSRNAKGQAKSRAE